MALLVPCSIYALGWRACNSNSNAYGLKKQGKVNALPMLFASNIGGKIVQKKTCQKI